MTASTPISAPKNYWIIGMKPDLILFVFTPILIIPVMLALKDRIAPETLGLYILGFGGFGHHLPGFIRAYADRDLFRRFKIRFTLVPLLLVSLSLLYSFLNLNALACAAVAWGTWHGAMQINGFLRIYDSKVKSFKPWTARLDWLMCLAWFGLAILHSPPKLFSLVTQFYVSGGILIPPAGFSAFRHIWDVFAIAITTLYAVNAYRQWKAGTPPSPVKLATLLSSFAFWWYCVVTVNNLILGLVMWEIYHDVQYNVLVWLFQRQRVKNNVGVGAAEKFLFTPGMGRAALYALMILGYGYIGVVSSYADLNSPEKIMMGGGFSPWLIRILAVSALLHFYFDGFIWRIREKATRQGLGVNDTSEAAKTEMGNRASSGKGESEQGKAARSETAPAKIGFLPTKHAWAWAFFILPIGYMGLAQSRGWNGDFEAQVLNLSETIPGSWLANFLAGTYYKGQGRFEEAERHYRVTVEFKPDFAEGHLFLADILNKEGKTAEAAEHFRRTVELDSANADARRNLAFLDLRMQQLPQAAEQFQILLATAPEDANLNFGMASALLPQGRAAEAQGYLEKTLRLSPNHSGALNYLGMIKDLQGDVPEAVALYRKALAADSGNVSARANLADALAKASVPSKTKP